MRAPIDEYYTDREYEFALKEMRRITERQRAIAEAKIALKVRDNLMKEFQKEEIKIADETKTTISTIQGQIDTAIQGEFRKSLDMYIPNMLSKYDKIGK